MLKPNPSENIRAKRRSDEELTFSYGELFPDEVINNCKLSDEEKARLTQLHLGKVSLRIEERLPWLAAYNQILGPTDYS